MRIAIVNDTFMSLFTLRKIIESDDRYNIAWTAENGEEAVTACAKDTPDLILMDIIMPVMDGVEATRQIMKNSPCAILLVTSSIDSNTSKVFNAMGAGALDAINTPIIEDSNGNSLDNGLLNKIEMIGKLIKHGNKEQKVNTIASANIRATRAIPLIAIGSSTGGPHALVSVLQTIPKNFPAAFIIVQHIDKQFVTSFIEWLDEQVILPVRMAQSGDAIEMGTILVSDSKKHLVLSPDQTLNYSKEPENCPYIPSVNTFFESVARNRKGETMGILLTGMGKDGAKGLLEMRNIGYTTIAQEESSCAIYGMPKAAVDINAAKLILSPIEINNKIVQSLGSSKHSKVESG